MSKLIVSNSHEAEKQFLHLYKVVLERENNLGKDALIVQYSTLLRFFVKFVQSKDKYNYKINEVLFDIYSKLGFIYYEDGVSSQEENKFFLAAEYYNHALSFTSNIDDKTRILLALKNIYYYLNDEKAYVKIEEIWAENHDAHDKYQAYMILAQNADAPHIKIQFLEKALNQVMLQNEGFYEKYQDTLYVCSQLAALYELIGQNKKALRIKKLRENTLKLLN